MREDKRPAVEPFHLDDHQIPPPPSQQQQDHHNFFSPSVDDLDDVHPSPPYRRDPSSSNLHLHLHHHSPLSPYTDDAESPAYASRSFVNVEMPSTHVNEKDVEYFREDIPAEGDVINKTSNDNGNGGTGKPSVHYPPDLRGPAPLYRREDSTDMFGNLSRPASIAATDDEYEEDYDWSGDEDLADGQVNYEKRIGNKPKAKGWGFKRIVTFLFSSLIGSTFLAGLLVTPALLVHFYWYLPERTERRQYINQNIQAWLFWAAANLLISWYLALIVDILPSVVTAFISGAWGHVSESVKSKVEMYNSVKNTVKPLLYAASCWASWIIIFEGIYKLYNGEEPENSRASYTRRISQVVAFGFFLVLLVCIQRMLSHAIAFSFHRTAYQDRIDAVNTALSVIETLRDYRPKPPNSGSGPRSGGRTPVLNALGMGSLGFGALGFGKKGNKGRGDNGDGNPPLDEKDHYKSLDSALRRHQGNQAAKDIEQYDGDTEEWGDGDGTIVGTGGRKGKSKLGQVHASPVASELGSRPGTPSALRNSYPATATPSRSGSQAQLNSYFAEKENSSPHRYPPTPLGMPLPTPGSVGLGNSPRESLDSNPHVGVGAVVTDAVGVVGGAVEKTAKVLKSAVLHDARNITGKDDKEGEESLVWGVANSKEAKRLARAIYLRFKDRRRNYLLPEDFYPAFDTPASAQAAFHVFDKDNNGDISRAEIKSTLIKVYKERRFLSRSMRDVGEALKTLDQILLLFAMVILFFISLSVFGVDTGDSLTSLYTLGIAASFVFKNAASEAFDAIMFLFVTHPYDTGDRVFIGTENLVVKKMGLFATVFTRSDGTETYFFNSQLFSQFITNVRRSAKMFENLTMQVAWNTPLVKLDALEKSMNEWLQTEENRWYEPSTSVVLQHIQFQRYLEITIGIGHNGTWQDWGLRNARKTAFHAAVQYFCRQLGIQCCASPIPIVYADPHTGAWRQAPTSTDDAPRHDDDDGASRRDDSVFEERRGYDEGLGERLPSRSRSSAGEEKMGPVLGFLPPESTRSSHLRARKSKGKKAMMRGDF